jgi:hypothetical protein
MAQGTERRQNTADGLAGASAVTPVIRQAPQLQAPNLQVQDLQNSQSAQIARSLSQWAGDRFQAVANTQHEASILDGQMAYQQGRAMEDVEMEGDKWSLSGYRVMNAQTLSQTMLTAQREMIQQTQFEQDPEQFRATYIQRLEAQIQGLDPQTARMVREQMSEQMPVLVSEHTQAHMRYQEEQSYDSLVTSVDALSQNASAFDALLTNAAGAPGSPSSGLSRDRRLAAVADGVALAFENMNPIAYQQLAQSGIMNDMSAAQQATMRGQQQAFENRVRSEYDADHQERMSNFQTELDSGNMTPEKAAETLSAIWGRRSVTTTAAQQGAAYDAASTAQDYGERAVVVNIATAQARNDWQAVAEMTQGFVMDAESGGRDVEGPLITSGANAGTRAQGAMQVMPKTLTDPGFGIRPSDGTRQDNIRVGDDYWAMLVERYDGDIEAAAIGYNAGPGNADNWVAAGRDYSVLPDRGQTEPYAQGITARADGSSITYSSAERLTMAQAELRTAQVLRDELMQDAQEASAVEARILYEGTVAELDADLESGLLAPSKYREQVEAARAAVGVERSVLDAARITDQINSAREQFLDESNEEAGEQVQIAQDVLTFAYETSMREATDTEQAGALTEEYLAAVQDLNSAAGFDLKQSDLAGTLNGTRAALRTAFDRIAEVAATDRVTSNLAGSGNLSAASQDEQDRWHERNATAISQDAANAEARGASADMQGALEDSWVQAGSVPSSVTATASSAMHTAVSANGNPSPAAISALQMYQRLLASGNSSAASQLFSTPETRGFADQALTLAEGAPLNDGSAGDILVTTNTNRILQRGLASGQTTEQIDTRDSDIRSRSARLVGRILRGEDIGWRQALFTSADLDTARRQSAAMGDALTSEEVQSRLVDHVVTETSRVMALDPGLSLRTATETAANNIGRRTVALGEHVFVTAPNEPTILERMYGEDSSTFDQPGAEHQALSLWLSNRIATDPRLEGLADVSPWETAGPFGQAVAGTGNLIASMFGGEVAQPVLTGREARRANDVGHRPFTVTIADGGLAVISTIMPNGNPGPTVAVNWSEVGEFNRAYSRGRLLSPRVVNTVADIGIAP